jgi:cysteine desulfurase
LGADAAGTGAGPAAGISGEAVLLELEARGIIGSSGSACAAGRDEPSHVLLALGIDPEIARTAIRFTLPVDFGLSDARAVAAALVDAVASVRALA